MSNATGTVIFAGLGALAGGLTAGARGAVPGAVVGGAIGLVIGALAKPGVPPPPVQSPPAMVPPSEGLQDSGLPWWWFYVLELQGDRWVRIYDSGPQQREASGVIDWLLENEDKYWDRSTLVRAWKWGYDANLRGDRWMPV